MLDGHCQLFKKCLISESASFRRNRWNQLLLTPVSSDEWSNSTVWWYDVQSQGLKSLLDVIYVFSLMFREISQLELSVFIPICALDIFGSLRIRAWYHKHDARKQNFGEEVLLLKKHQSSVRWLHMPPLVLFSLQWSDKWSKKLRCRPSWSLIITCNGLARCWGGIRPAGQVVVGRRMASSSNNESRANWTPICCHAKRSEPLKTASSHSERISPSGHSHSQVGMLKDSPGDKCAGVLVKGWWEGEGTPVALLKRSADAHTQVFKMHLKSKHKHTLLCSLFLCFHWFLKMEVIFIVYHITIKYNTHMGWMLTVLNIWNIFILLAVLPCPWVLH